MQHPVIGLLGASGGLGVSTLSVALAARASPGVGTVACVDADFAGGGLDVTACLEHLPGLRWPDLAGARGDLDGAALLHSLPCDHSIAVLGSRGSSPGSQVVDAALTSLRAICGLTILDLGRSPAMIGTCSSMILVTGTSARQLADADAVARQLVDWPWPAAGEAVLVLRRTPGADVRAEDVATHLDLPLGAILPHDPRIARAADHGAMPGLTRSAVTAAADELLAQLHLSGPAMAGVAP